MEESSEEPWRTLFLSVTLGLLGLGVFLGYIVHWQTTKTWKQRLKRVKQKAEKTQKRLQANLEETQDRVEELKGRLKSIEQGDLVRRLEKENATLKKKLSKAKRKAQSNEGLTEPKVEALITYLSSLRLLTVMDTYLAASTEGRASGCQQRLKEYTEMRNRLIYHVVGPLNEESKDLNLMRRLGMEERFHELQREQGEALSEYPQQARGMLKAIKEKAKRE